MNYIFLLKMGLVAVIILLLAYFALNATFSFISKFSDQLQKMTKNLLIAVGIGYALGLVFAPVTVLELSLPILELVHKIAPNFFGK